MWHLQELKALLAWAELKRASLGACWRGWQRGGEAGHLSARPTLGRHSKASGRRPASPPSAQRCRWGRRGSGSQEETGWRAQSGPRRS